LNVAAGLGLNLPFLSFGCFGGLCLKNHLLRRI
jgi:hypothetical protein